MSTEGVLLHQVAPVKLALEAADINGRSIEVEKGGNVTSTASCNSLALLC